MELDQIMAQIFDQLAQNKQAIVDAVVTVLQSVPDEHDYSQDRRALRRTCLPSRQKRTACCR